MDFDSLISQYKSDGKRESGRTKSLTVDVISRTTIKGQLDMLIMLSDFWSACLSNFVLFRYLSMTLDHLLKCQIFGKMRGKKLIFSIF